MKSGQQEMVVALFTVELELTYLRMYLVDSVFPAPLSPEGRRERGGGRQRERERERE